MGISLDLCLQVLDERVYHIEYAPEQPETYYKATGKELQPRPVGEEHGIIVYNYMPISAVHYVSILLPNCILKVLTWFMSNCDADILSTSISYS